MPLRCRLAVRAVRLWRVRQVREALRRACARGAVACSVAPTSCGSPGRGTFRLVDCRRGGMATAVALGRVHGVLRSEFDYGLADLRAFDYAALLQEVGLGVGV